MMLAKSWLKNCLRQAETASRRSRRLRFETTALVTSRRIRARSASPTLRRAPGAACVASIPVDCVSSGMSEGGRLIYFTVNEGGEIACEVRGKAPSAGRLVPENIFQFRRNEKESHLGLRP